MRKTAFAAALPNGRVQVLETKDGRERFNVTATEEQTICVMFSPDNSTLLTSAGFSDAIIHLLDAHSGEGRGSLEGHNSYVTDLLFTPDGSQLISSSADQTIRLAIGAGNDLVMICHRIPEIENVLKILGTLPREQTDRALVSVAKFKKQTQPPQEFSEAAFRKIDKEIWELRVATLGEERAKQRSVEDGKRSPVEIY